MSKPKHYPNVLDLLRRAETPATIPPFSDIDIRVDPDGDDWMLTVVGMPDNSVIAKDHFWADDLAVARGNDFARLITKYWSDVRIHRHYPPKSRPKSA